MLQRAISPGDEVDSYCGKCKIERVHNVIALVDGRVVKCVCKTCGSQHRYKPVSSHAGSVTRIWPASPPTKPRKTNDGPEAATVHYGHSGLWEEALAQKNLSDSKPYTVKGSFEAGDVIQHSMFGYGIVTDVQTSGKMHVLFKQGSKKLVCLGAG